VPATELVGGCIQVGRSPILCSTLTRFALLHHAVLCCAMCVQSLTKPVTDLMTRSTPAEVAAFATDPHFPTNNTAYKHMISQWG
jgi:hypothetical protein